MNLKKRFQLRSLLVGAVMANPFGAGTPTVEPVQSAFNSIKAQNYSAMRGIEKYDYYVKEVDGTDYLGFSKVDFGDGALSMEAQIAAVKQATPQKYEIRLDRTDGPLVGLLNVAPTGSWRNFTPQYVNLTKVTGIHDVYLVGQGGRGIGNISSFKFSKSYAPTQPSQASRMDTIMSDMVNMHDMKIQNISATGAWATGPGHVGIGRDATKIAPWGEVFVGQGHAATNARVQIRNWKIYWQRSSDRTWYLLRTVTDLEGGFYGNDKYLYSGKKVSFRVDQDGISIQRPPEDPNISWAHFWSTTPYETMAPEKGNIQALMITAQYRLVLDNPNGVDDLDRAQYMVRIGMDDPTHIKPGYISAILGTRAKKATRDWQSITGFTLDRSTGVNVWENISPNFGISEAELRSNPPPLN